MLKECRKGQKGSDVKGEAGIDTFFSRMDQACRVHPWVRQHPSVPQPAFGDLWRDRVEHPGHRRAPDRPHRERLWQRQLLRQICATSVWWVQAYDWKHVNLLTSDPLFLSPLFFVSGAVRGEVDLLPPPSPAANWTSALPTLPSSDSSLIFSFNGSNHVAVVPDSVVSALSGDHFTLQLWMRRGGANIQPATTQTRGNRKEEETIVCSTVRNGKRCPSHINLAFGTASDVVVRNGFASSLFYPLLSHLNP